MKHFLTFITAVVFISASVKAAHTRKGKGNNRQVAVAPFIWGNPSDEAPAELSLSKTTKLKVPVAPLFGEAMTTFRK